MNAIGKRIGKEVANQMKAEDRAGFFEDLKRTWADLGLGAVEIDDGERLQISVRDSFSCQGMTGAGKPLCTLDEGILTGVIEQRLHLACEAVERLCVGLGNDHCTYEVSFVPGAEAARPSPEAATPRGEALAPHA